MQTLLKSKCFGPPCVISEGRKFQSALCVCAREDEVLCVCVCGGGGGGGAGLMKMRRVTVIMRRVTVIMRRVTPLSCSSVETAWTASSRCRFSHDCQ